MVPGFHTSSLEFHAPAALVVELAALGFGTVAIRPCRGRMDLATTWYDTLITEIAAAANDNGIRIVIDLDAPFYDDPHSATPFALASCDADRSAAAVRKIEDWIERSVDLRPLTITFSTGRTGPPDAISIGDEQVLERIASRVTPLCQRASDAGITLSLRPAADHAIATVAHFERFGQWIDSDLTLGLAADVGEMLLGGEFPIGARLARLEHRLSCVYLCEPDLERGCDQRFGCGDIDLGRVWNVMTQSGFSGPGIFRACGHGRLGLDLAKEAIALTREV